MTENVEDTKEDEAGAGEGGARGAAESAPEKYENFTFPEGVEADAKLMEGFLPAAKEANLTQETAQKFLDLQIAGAQAAAEANTKAWESTVEGWKKSTADDKDIGGDKLKENEDLGKKALNALGTPELSKILDDYGFREHIEFVRFLAEVGRAIGDDTQDVGRDGPAGEKDAAATMFPDQN